MVCRLTRSRQGKPLKTMRALPFAWLTLASDGEPFEMRIVDKSNWISKAQVFPLVLLAQVKARPWNTDA
jgi:hypothetical protein